MAIERIIPGTTEWDAFYANHLQRYQFACGILSERKQLNLLDAACGVGYGTHQLSGLTGAVSVTGVDRSEDALSLARKHFPRITSAISGMIAIHWKRQQQPAPLMPWSASKPSSICPTRKPSCAVATAI